MKEETTYTSSQEDLKKLQNDTILKRIPANSEATTVLVCMDIGIILNYWSEKNENLPPFSVFRLAPLNSWNNQQ